MSKVSYSYTMGGNAIDIAIPTLEKSVGSLVSNVQKIAVSILQDMKKHGDKPTACRRANDLVKALGKGLRAKSLLGWFEQNAPMVWNKEEKKLVPGFTGMSPVKDYQKIEDAAVLSKRLWQEAVNEPEYVPLDDWNKALKALVQRARKDLEKMGENSKVNKDQLTMLERMAGVPVQIKSEEDIPH